MACSGALGRNAKLYVKTGETDTSDATWSGYTAVEIKAAMDDAGWKEICAVDVSWNGQKDKIDTSDRCTGDYKAYVPGQQEATVTFKAYKRKPITSGEWLDILRTAYADDSAVSVMMLDDAATVTGADGIIANVNVFNLSETQNLTGPIEIDFELAVSGCTTYAPPARTLTRPA